MTKAKKTRKFAQVKRMIKPNSDERLKVNKDKAEKKKQIVEGKEGPKFVERVPTALFFKYNTQLGPP